MQRGRKRETPKILVVEDERVVAADIEECLRKLGYAVAGAAASGMGAIRRAVETAPDLVLMDIKLKGAMDGIDAAVELHDRLGIPVVFLTAFADSEILERAKNSSPSGYVLKPFDERALRSAVEIALHRHPKERELAASERRLVTALRSFGEAVILTQDDGRVTFLNRAAERLTGWRLAEAIGHPAGDVFIAVNARSGALHTNPVTRVMQEKSVIGLGDETTLISQHGHETWIQGSASPLWNDRELVGVALVFHPASRAAKEFRGAPEAVRCDCRYETLGRLASGIAQDFGAVLSDIQQHVNRLREEGAAGPPSPEWRGIEQRLSEGQNLLRKILSLARERPPRPKLLSVNEVIGSLERMLEHAAGESIEVQTVPRRGVGLVNADPAQLEQLVLDLVLECRRRIPAGGRITIETDEVDLLSEYARSHTNLGPGRYVLLSVRHGGSVMLPSSGDFEAEMPSVLHLARDLGGDITVHDEPGRLSIYEVYLPRAGGKPAEESAIGC